MTRSLGAVLISATALAAPGDPTLEQVLGKAASYVGDFERQLSRIIAEERCEQKVEPSKDSKPKRSMYGTGTLQLPVHTKTRADFLLLRTSGASRYVQYRDVFEQDGQPVRHRDERLARLFSGGATASEAERQQIINENARFNVGDVLRTMNLPVLALEFLRFENQSRFSFKRTSESKPSTFAHDATPSDAFRISREVWIVEYKERMSPTTIRTDEGKDIEARGRFWIEPDTGRVVMTELIVDNRSVRGALDVSFQSEPLLGFLVPVEMRERYDAKRNGSVITATTTYGRFRVLQPQR